MYVKETKKLRGIVAEQHKDINVKTLLVRTTMRDMTPAVDLELEGGKRES